MSLHEAAAAYNARNFALAEELYGEVLEAEPTNGQAKLARAVSIARQKGRQADAIRALYHFLSFEPDSQIALNWLSKMLREKGRHSEALNHAKQAVKVGPVNADVTYNLGLCYIGLERYEEAIHWLERSITAAPKLGAAYYALACVYEAIGQPWQALLAMKSNIALDPYPPGFLKLAQLFLAVGDTAQAEEFGLKALSGNPTPTVHLLLADIYADSQPEKSAAHYQTAISQNPTLAAQFANERAKRLSRQGRLEEARQINLQELEQSPNSGIAALNLITIKRATEEDRDLIEGMKSALEHVDPSEEASLHFALAKAYDDLGEYEEAMNHYDRANGLLLAHRLPFDRKRFTARIDAEIALFTKEFVARHQIRVEGSSRPIFIVGMMRSGTTLMEQILSSHSRVAAGGELAHWAYSERKVVDFAAQSLRTETLKECRAKYLELLQEISSGATHVTDKNPANCFYLGMIACAFPNAHIVHMVRDPVDTALSIYMTPTRNPPEFGGDRASIAYAIRETSRLMQHWQGILPIHRVLYEDVVSTQEATTQKLASDLGLEWQDWMLHPESNKATASTPSLFQVRQGVKAGISRTDRYRPWLREFKDLDR